MNMHSTNRYQRVCRTTISVALVCSALICGNKATAQENSESETIESALTNEAALSRSQKSLVVVPDSTEATGELQIPRFAASLRSMSWTGGETAGLSITPEQDYWVIKWTQRPGNSESMLLEFDSRALLVDEIQPIKASGDGGFLLPAHLAKTAGAKVRYEPQMHKNTVGYWTGKEDQASWSFQVARPGKFNVGILQGCGKGQGGSAAKIEIREADEVKTSLEFEVLETGHFQNFQWRHLGTIELDDSGVLELRISPNSIKKAALMDVRAVSLVRLPE